MKPFKNAIIYLTLFGMETCWVYGALKAANQSVDNILSLPLLLSALFISLGVSVLLKFLPWPKVVLTALSWTIWPLVFLLMVKFQIFSIIDFGDRLWLSSIGRAFAHIFYRFEAPLLIFLSTAVMWWLGRRMAYLKPDFSTAMVETQLGVILVALVFFSSYQLNLDMSGSTGLALVFFFLALLGIALSHARGESWLFSTGKRQWMGITLVLIGLILALGLVASYIFTPGLIQLFLNAIAWVWAMIERVLAFFASLFPPSAPPSTEIPPLPSMPPVSTETTGGIHWPAWLKPSLLLVWEIIILGLLIAAVWRIATGIFHWLQHHAPDRGAETESLKGGFWSDLLNFLKNMLFRILRIRIKPREDDSLKNLPPQVISVRDLYAQLLRWTAAKGYPREKHQTPDEYRTELCRLMPEKEKGLEFITGEYIKARYGSGIPSDETLTRMRDIWHDLKKTGIKKTGK
jgi:hypothetical protein